MRIKYVEALAGSGGLQRLGAADWESISSHLARAGIVSGDTLALIRLDDLRVLVGDRKMDDHLCYVEVGESK